MGAYTDVYKIIKQDIKRLGIADIVELVEVYDERDKIQTEKLNIMEITNLVEIGFMGIIEIMKMEMHL